MTSQVTVEEINTFLREAFEANGGALEAIEVSDGTAKMKLAYNPAQLRPGGVISGPTQMSIADSATYIAIFTKIGITPFAVTSNLNMNFLNPCIAGDVIATANILKIGNRLAVAEVDIREANMTHPASHAIVTYALPSR